MAEHERSLTVVISTYQRRDAVLALLEGLRPQVEAERGTDVLVVVDGSSDGTTEAVEGLAAAYPVPLTVERQANAGLAAARNRGLQRAAGELVWFLDDDMLPAPGLVAAHRAAHRGGGRRFVIGPCPFPPEVPAVPLVRAWAEHKYGELERAGRMTDAVLFSAANTSGPAELWRAVGGFDASFVGWGGEDYEIAVRLLAAGVEVRYAPEAVAWHHQDRSIAGFCATKREEGRNTVRIVRKHPHALEELLPVARGRGPRALLALAGRRPRAYAALARALAAAAGAAPRGGTRLLALAARMSFIAGVADADGRYLERLLGGAPSRRDSSQPRANPTGSQ